MAHIDLAIQLPAYHGQEQPPHGLGVLAGTIEQQPCNADVTGTGQPIGDIGGQNLLKAQRHRIPGWQRHQVGGRTLQHGNVRSFLRHRWYQGDGRGTTANHHHTFAGIVQVLRPVLRMHNLPAKIGLAREVGLIAGIVVVIPCTAHQKAGGKGNGFAGGFLAGRQCPALVCA